MDALPDLACPTGPTRASRPTRPLRPTRLTRRRLLLGAAATAVVGCAAPSTSPRAPALRLLGEAVVPHRLSFKGTTVGGLSALDYDPASQRWYALSDDRSELQPARFYTLDLALTTRGLASPQLLDVVTLRQPDGSPYPARGKGAGEVADPEGLRWCAQTSTLLWTSEGDGRAGLDPFVREIRPDGQHVRTFSLPPMFAMRQSPGQGPRDNLTFEGLALTPDGRSAWVAMEGPLQQDGPVPSLGAPGGPCRFTRFDVRSGQPVGQIAYLCDAIAQPSVPAGAYADNGVSEILMLDAQRMLVLERAYMTGVGNSLRLYVIDTSAASDTLAQPTLQSGHYRPATKTLVADFAHTGLARLDNTEGMCWGPRLSGGGRSIVFVSDDNFNPRQVTQFVAFEFLD